MFLPSVTKLKEWYELVRDNFFAVSAGFVLGVIATSAVFTLVLTYGRSQSTNVQTPPAREVRRPMKRGERLEATVKPALDDPRSWVQAFVQRLVAREETAVMVETSPSEQSLEPFRVVVRTTVQGTVSGYALLCAGPAAKPRCEILGDEFSHTAPSIEVPGLQPGARLLVILKLGEAQVRGIADLNRVVNLEVQ